MTTLVLIRSSEKSRSSNQRYPGRSTVDVLMTTYCSILLQSGQSYVILSPIRADHVTSLPPPSISTHPHQEHQNSQSGSSSLSKTKYPTFFNTLQHCSTCVSWVHYGNKNVIRRILKLYIYSIPAI